MSPNVSLALIVKNEAKNLPGCLDGLAGLVAEIVVVDTGSTDGTPDVARRFGARVLDFPWVDDFAAARNASITAATKPWIFWMDADDRLDGDGRERLGALFAGLGDAPDGYLMRCVCVNQAAMETFALDHVRLFRNDPRIRFTYRVHEQVAQSILRAGGKLRRSDVVLRHEGYQDEALYAAKQARNLRLIELQAQEMPLDPFVLYYRGVCLLDNGRPGEALVAWSLCDGRIPSGTAIGRDLPVQMAEAYRQEGMISEAHQVLQVARAKRPDSLRLAFEQALLAYRTGDMGGAEVALLDLESLSDAPGAIAFEDPSIAAFRARHLRAAVRLLSGQWAAAEEDARAVVRAAPAFGEGWLLLADTLREQRKDEAFAGLLAEIESSGRAGRVAGAILRAGRLARDGDLDGARALVDGELSADPTSVFLRRARVRLTDGPPDARVGGYFLATREVPGMGLGKRKEVLG